jgi:hypothetical protein
VDHPPSTTSSSRPARRALLTSAAALSAIAAPVAVVGLALGGEPSGSQAPEAVRTELAASRVSSQDATQAVRFVDGASTIGADVGTDLVEGEAAALRGIVLPTTTTIPPTTTTTAAPTTTVAPAPTRKGDPGDPATWDRLAQCESGGNWSINSGNGYYGGLQFSATTWRSVGGTGYPHQHSRETQIEMGKRLQARAGWSQWPSCTRRLGYR